MSRRKHLANLSDEQLDCIDPWAFQFEDYLHRNEIDIAGNRIHSKGWYERKYGLPLPPDAEEPYPDEVEDIEITQELIRLVQERERKRPRKI